jgi:hypothetical protein
MFPNGLDPNGELRALPSMTADLLLINPDHPSEPALSMRIDNGMEEQSYPSFDDKDVTYTPKAGFKAVRYQVVQRPALTMILRVGNHRKIEQEMRESIRATMKGCLLDELPQNVKELIAPKLKDLEERLKQLDEWRKEQMSGGGR